MNRSFLDRRLLTQLRNPPAGESAELRELRLHILPVLEYYLDRISRTAKLVEVCADQLNRAPGKVIEMPAPIRADSRILDLHYNRFRRAPWPTLRDVSGDVRFSISIQWSRVRRGRWWAGLACLPFLAARASIHWLVLASTLVVPGWRAERFQRRQLAALMRIVDEGAA